MGAASGGGFLCAETPNLQSMGLGFRDKLWEKGMTMRNSLGTGVFLSHKIGCHVMVESVDVSALQLGEPAINLT